MMRVGFTGTREGLTLVQRESLLRVLTGYTTEPSEFHHGDCIGADEQAHNIASRLGYEIFIHPPTNPKYRAYCQNGYVLIEADYLQRNRDICGYSEMLVACPRTPKKIVRSGTWYTINHAQSHYQMPVTIIYPDGTVEKS